MPDRVTRRQRTGAPQMRFGKTSVVGIAVIGVDQAHPGGPLAGGAQLPVRTPGPVQPRRAIVRAREPRGGALEHANRLGVVTGGVSPPPVLPCRAFRVQALGELRVLLAEG